MLNLIGLRCGTRPQSPQLRPGSFDCAWQKTNESSWLQNRPKTAPALPAYWPGMVSHISRLLPITSVSSSLDQLLQHCKSPLLIEFLQRFASACLPKLIGVSALPASRIHTGQQLLVLAITFDHVVQKISGDAVHPVILEAQVPPCFEIRRIRAVAVRLVQEPADIVRDALDEP